jgi:hypothetical protein
MALTKVSKSKEDSSDVESSALGSSESYPYGTELTLEDDLYDALNIANLSVDDEVTVIARAKVSRKSEHNVEASGNNVSRNSKSMSIQITELEVKSGEDDRVKKLYG